MAKITRNKKQKPAAAPVPTYSPEAQETRKLLRRVPDGLKATLTALTSRPAEERERILSELARGMGKEVLPLLRSAALAENEDLALSAVRVLPVLGTRAAADVLVEAYQAKPETERARQAQHGARALRARGINVAIPEEESAPEPLRYTLRETFVSVPDGVGSRSVAARLQDQYGVWHAILVLWNDQAGIKDGFMRPLSRQEWDERLQRMSERGLPQTGCPLDFARWQIHTARELNASSGVPIGDHLTAWDEHIGAPPEGYQPPDPSAAVAAATEEERAEWTAAAVTLFKLDEVKRWFLEAADCAVWAKQWLDLQVRLRQKTDDEALRVEVQDVVRQAAEALLDEKQRSYYEGRLLDLARVFEWRRQDLRARQAAMAAWLIRQGKPLADQPFLQSLTERSLMTAAILMQRGEDLERSRYRPTKRYSA